MGILGQKLTGSDPGSLMKKQQKIDQPLIDARNFALSRARDLVTRPYQRYEGQRVAGLSGNEQQAGTIARESTGEAQGLVRKGVEQLDNMDEFSGDTVKKYMNPYTEGVVDVALRKNKEAYLDNVNSLNAKSASIGAFGGDRATQLQSQAEKNYLQNAGDITATGYDQAYKEAISTWQGDNNRRIASAEAYRAAGNDLTNMNSQQISDLMRTGGAGRAIDQLNLDVGYSDFVENRDWETNNLQPLLQLVGATKGNTGTYPGGSAGNAGQVIGAISAIAGFFGGGSTGYKPAGGTGAGGGSYTSPSSYSGMMDSQYGGSLNA
jgi:hypothetical protein